MGRPKPTPASPLIPYCGPIIVVDEKCSWRKHVKYPVFPSSPSWKSPSSPPFAPPKPSKPKTRKSKPTKYAYYCPDSPFSLNFEDWDFPDYIYIPASAWTTDGPKIRHREDDVQACHSGPPRPRVDQARMKAYSDKASRQAYVKEDCHASTEEYESEASRRMRVAREVGEQMRADEEMLKQKQKARMREAEKVHWEMHFAREREMRRESERKAERAHWEMQMAREQAGRNKNTWEEKEWERVRVVKKEGLGNQGLEGERWERVPNVRSKREAKPEYGLRYQKPREYEEWKLELHNSEKGKNNGKGVMQRPQRWIEVREKPEGEVEVVMVKRRKPRY